jgi:Protein of unknown function (DUF3987)
MNKDEIHRNALRLTQNIQQQGFEAESLHTYTDEKGNAIFWRLRLRNKATGQKEIRPMSYRNGQFLLKEPELRGKKPIYKLHLISDADLIYWVEGESKADALCELGIVATTAGGATSHTSADFEPLRGKRVRIWPDNDSAGQAHASSVELILKEMNCSVAIIEISGLDLPKGGDFIDWQKLNPNVKKEDVLNLPLIQPSESADKEDEIEDLRPIPYPLDALPESIRLAVAEVADFIKAPISLIASSALSAISLATQSQCDVERDRKLTGPTSLYFLVIADSGERKSTADKYFTKAIKIWEKQQIEKFKPEITQFKSEFSIWSNKRSGLLNKIKNPKSKDPPLADLEKSLKALDLEEPIPPKIPRLLYQDATPEALGYSLFKIWPAGGIVSAEGGIVFGSHGMNQESVMRNLATLNLLWDGADLTVDRKTQESYTLMGARLTISLQVQEPTVRNFITKSGNLARGTGFLARFLIAYPESTQGDRPYTESPVVWPHLEAFEARLAVLLNAPQPFNGMGILEPLNIPLSLEAKELWINAHDNIEKSLNGELYAVRDVASKTADNIARIACLLHVFEGITGPISAQHMQSAISLGIWHLDESRRFLSKLTLSPKENNANKLLDWLMQEYEKTHQKTITQRHAQQFGPVRDKKELMEALKYLEEYKSIELIKEGKSTLIKPKSIYLEKD